MRLIDIDAINWYDDLYMKGVNHSGVWVRYRDVEHLIQNAPTVDAVPVVRCRECKWWRGPVYGNRCSYHSGPTHTEFYDADEFCSRGERKGGDE